MNIFGFGPVVSSNSKVLILGSMPGVTSLQEHQYYAYPRNHFWRIIFSVFNSNYLDDYQQRLEFIINNNLALWDVLKTCDRKGSLDSDIKHPLINNFKWLFKAYPNIQYILFNGGKAKQLFARHTEKLWTECKIMKTLPSTSPTNTMAFEIKLKQWQILSEICLN